MRHIAKGALSIVLAATLVIAGCSTSWINIALADLPVITQVALNIASIVAQSGVADSQTATQIQSVSNEVKADLTLVQSLIESYQSSPATQRATILAQINTALSSAQGNFQAILAAAHVKDPALQATITGAVSIALSTLVAIQSLVPAPSGAVKASRPIKPMSAKELKKEFNAVFVGNGFPQAQIQ